MVGLVEVEERELEPDGVLASRHAGQPRSRERLRGDPAERPLQTLLGPVEIRVSMNADQANLSFFSPHAAVREAIQAALPRLTDAFAASCLTLGNVLVGAESQSGRQPNEREAPGRFSGAPTQDFSAPETATAVTWLRPGSGLGRVDLFA